MMTHHKRKTYHCTQPGCHKSYNDKKSLKHHCASRHGAHFTSPSSTSLAYNSDLPASQLESMVNRAASDSRSLSISQPKPVSSPVLKDPSYSGKLKLGLGCSLEDTYPAQVKCSAPQESWTLAAASESYKFAERTKILDTTQWILGMDTAEKNPVVSHDPLDVLGLETNLEERNYSATTSGVGFPTRPPTSVGHKKHCPILPKHNLKDPKPLNKLKRRHSISSFTPSVLLCPEPKSNFPDPAPPSPPHNAPLPKSRRRKSCSKDTKDALSNVPTPPLPVPQPSCHKRSRSRSSYLVSPSQVALASFSSYLGNPFLQKVHNILLFPIFHPFLKR